MNERRVFVPSLQLRERSEAPKYDDSKRAAKAVQESGQEDELSAEELTLCAKLAADKTAGLARIYENGELVCVGTQWVAGRKPEHLK